MIRQEIMNGRNTVFSFLEQLLGNQQINDTTIRQSVSANLHVLLYTGQTSKHQTDRQTNNKQANKQRDKQTNRQTNKQTSNNKECHRHADRQQTAERDIQWNLS